MNKDENFEVVNNVEPKTVVEVKEPISRKAKSIILASIFAGGAALATGLVYKLTHLGYVDYEVEEDDEDDDDEETEDDDDEDE